MLTTNYFSNGNSNMHRFFAAMASQASYKLDSITWTSNRMNVGLSLFKVLKI